MATDDNTYTELYPDTSDQFSRGPSVDFHTQLHRVAEQLERNDKGDLTVRLQRALSMMKRAVDRADWSAYDAWAAQAAKYREALGGK